MNLVYPRALAVCAITLTAAAAHAQYRPVATTSPAENYHVELDAALWNPAADLQIGSGVGGSTIDAKRDLGLQDTKSGGYELVVKPALKHKFRVQFIPMSYKQTGAPPSTLVFSGQTYPAGVPVASTIDYTAWRFGYEYDFVSSARGFAGMIVDVEYADVNTTMASAGRTASASAKAPIPALGGIARVYLASKLSLTGALSGFKVPGGWINTSGHYADMDLYAMLNLVDSFGIRAGYRKFHVEYVQTNDTGTFTLSGPYLGLSIRF